MIIHVLRKKRLKDLPICQSRKPLLKEKVISILKINQIECPHITGIPLKRLQVWGK
jgi:hypothetical protein